MVCNLLSTISPPGFEPGKQDRSDRYALLGAVVLTVALVAAGVVAVGVATDATAPASANNTTLPDYYANETVTGPDDGWVGDGNATLDRLVDLVTRVPGYVIGTGEVDSSGTGYTGVLLTGLVMAAAAVGVVVGIGVGPVGGAIVALSVGFGLSRVGLAPSWIRIVLLFGLGLLAAIAIRRTMQR